MSDDSYSVKEVIKEFRDDVEGWLSQISADIKETKHQTTQTNGRVTKLEIWSNDAQKVIEADNKIIARYLEDKTKIYTALAILLLVAGAFFSLAISWINNRIDRKIESSIGSYLSPNNPYK